MGKVKKRSILLHSNPSQNVIRNLMLRDLGLHSINKTSARELESIAETNLVLKSHRELKCDLPGIPRATFLMVFSPDGTKLASTHGNHNVYITEVKTGKNIRTLSGHPRTPWCIAFHPSSSQILASGCLGGQVRVWDLSGGSEIWNAVSHTVIASLAFHPSEQLLAIATFNEIHFWDWSKSEPFAVASTGSDQEKVRYVAFDNLGRKLITGIANILPYRPKKDRPPLEQPYRTLLRNQLEGIQDPETIPRYHLWDASLRGYRMMNSYTRRAQNLHNASDFRAVRMARNASNTSDVLPDSRERQRNSASLRRVFDEIIRTLCAEHVYNTENVHDETLDDENSGEQSENGYWLLEENSNSDSNLDEASTSNASNSRRWTSRWIQLDSSNRNYNNNNNNNRTSLLVEPTHTRFTSDEIIQRAQNRFSNRNQITLTSANSLSYEQPPLYPFRSLQENQFRRLVQHTVSEANPSSSSLNHHQQQQQQQQQPVNPPANTSNASIKREYSSTSNQTNTQETNIPRKKERTEGESSMENQQQRENNQAEDQLRGDNVRSERLSRNTNESNARDIGGEGFRRWRYVGLNRDVGLHPLEIRLRIRLLGRQIDNMQRLCRARIEIAQLQQVRRMWEELQDQIRSLYVTVRVEGQNNNRETSAGQSNISTNAKPSTSGQNSSRSTDSQSESNKKFNKTLLESFKRENSETGNTKICDQNQPSTSTGITSSSKFVNSDSQNHSSNNDETENSTNIRLSNLLPSESELRDMETHNLSNILDNLFSQCQNCNLPDNSQYTNNDHTYSNLTNNDGNVQLPSISSLVSNIGIASNLQTISAITTATSQSSNISHLINNQINNPSSVTNETAQTSDNVEYSSEDVNTQLNNNNTNNNEYVNINIEDSSNISENLNQRIQLDSSSSNINSQNRPYMFQRVLKYGRRMYLRNSRLSPLAAKRGSRSHSSNESISRENVRRPWHSRRNPPNICDNAFNENNSERNQVQSTSEFLQVMILRLEFLVRQQRALAQNNNIARSFDSNNQMDNITNSENEEIEQIREATRLQARQVLSLMVGGLTQFIQMNRPENGSQSNMLYEQIYKMYFLLHLALELTDLLLAQLVSTRQELESSQYGPYGSDLSSQSNNSTEIPRNNNLDNRLRTEEYNSRNNVQVVSENNDETEIFERNIDAENPRTSLEINQANTEDLFSLDTNRNRQNMAERLKRLFFHPQQLNRGSQSNTNEEHQNLNHLTSHVNNSINTDNTATFTAQNHEFQQAGTSTANNLSEHALSVEIQNIVERIQNNSSINTDSSTENNNRRRSNLYPLGNNITYRNNGSRELRSSHEASNAAVNRRGLRNYWQNASTGLNQYLNEIQQRNQRINPSNWSNFIQNEQNNRRPLSYQGPGLSPPIIRRVSAPLRGYVNRYLQRERIRRRISYRNGVSRRQELNVPVIRVNGIPLNELRNLPGSQRRRHIAPPHILPPYLIDSFPNDVERNGNNNNNNINNSNNNNNTGVYLAL